MTQRMDQLIDAISECIVACQGRVNRDRAKAVLAVIEARGWAVVPRPSASTMGLIRKLSKKTGMAAADIDLAVCHYIDAAKEEA